MAKVARAQIAEGRVHGRKATARKDAKEQRKGGTGDSKTCWTCAKASHILASCPQCGNKNTYCMGEEESEDNGEESEHEQCQNVITRREKTETEASRASLIAEYGKQSKLESHGNH